MWHARSQPTFSSPSCTNLTLAKPDLKPELSESVILINHMLLDTQHAFMAGSWYCQPHSAYGEAEAHAGGWEVSEPCVPLFPPSEGPHMPLSLPCEQQELPARVNFSAAPAPAVPTALHSKMDELEGQLLAKVLALEKERVALSHSSHQQRQEVEKELDALQGRIAELEHGGSWAPQRA